MSLQIPDLVGAEAGEEGVLPACRSTLTSDKRGDEAWQLDEAATYPPGYPRMCQHPECFGEVEGPRDEKDRMPEYDHTDDVDVLVRSTGSRNTNRKRHRLGEVDGSE